MRSCDSEMMISHGSMSLSRSGTRSRWTSIPAPSRAISASADASPAAPQSCSDSTSPASTSSSAGIFATIGTAAAGDAQRPGAGPALMLSFVLTAVVCAFTALCYAEFASMVPVAGSAYTYAYATLGELLAWVIGWDLVLEYAVGSATVAHGWSAHFQEFIPIFHEGIAAIGLVPHGLAADVRDADAVAVVADAGDGALEIVVVGAEPQPVEQRDRACAHRDDVAEDPPDAGRGTLEGLHRGRMVVRLDLEGDGVPFAEVDHAGVLTGALQDPFSSGRKALEQEGRVLVPAVLRPEQ